MEKMERKMKKNWMVRWAGGGGEYTQSVEADYYRQEGHLIKFYSDEPNESELDPVTRALTEIVAYSVFRIVSFWEYDPDEIVEEEETEELAENSPAD